MWLCETLKIWNVHYVQLCICVVLSTFKFHCFVSCDSCAAVLCLYAKLQSPNWKLKKESKIRMSNSEILKWIVKYNCVFVLCFKKMNWNDVVSLSLKRRCFNVHGWLTNRLTSRLTGWLIIGSVRFGKSVNRLPNRPIFGKKILFRLPNRILSVKSVGG